MVCSKWETTGLLVASNELTQAQRADYNQHLAECDYCRTELSWQQSLSKTYSVALMADVVPESIDAAINRAAMNPIRPATGFFTFAPIWRNVTAGVLFLALGLGGGAYIALNIGASQQQAVAQVKSKTPAVVQAASGDSTNDSSTTAPVKTPVGQGSSQVIIPVGLESR